MGLPVLRGEASQGLGVAGVTPVRPVPVFTSPGFHSRGWGGGGGAGPRRGGQRAWSHTPIRDWRQAPAALLSGLLNQNKIPAPDGDAGSGSPQ